MTPTINPRHCPPSLGLSSISSTRASKRVTSISLVKQASGRRAAPVTQSGIRIATHRTSFRSIICGAMSLELSALFYIVFAVIALTMAPAAVAFNVDIERSVVHTGTTGSMFGFAVAQHSDQSINWLLVGAPRAQTSQVDVEKGGAVLRCKTDTSTPCQVIPFDDTGDNVKYVPRLNRYVKIEQKSGQWFGSTVKSSGQNGVIVACAPRYMYFSEQQDKREPVGVCYLAKASTTKFDKYAPCATAVDNSDTSDQYHRQGYCQAGVSAVLSNDGKRLLIGAPGSWYWQGQLFNYKTDNNGEVLDSTPEGSPEEDDTYMGYSSAIGEFDGDGSEDYVIGIPKGQRYLGMVEFFNQNLTSMRFIYGEQIGSYFGYSVAVVDLNGDRMDDVIVGAPMYADFESSDSYDTGRVYIYYQTSEVDASGKSQRAFTSETRDVLDGQSSRSRFGLALSSLGDINYDGYSDLCVGAPYAGEDQKGAVYIYHGSKKGIITEVSQVIYAKDLDPALSAFGFSISGGLDQDGNSYPDVLVGAYTSDRAVFLRTKPVVRVHASLKLEDEMISLDSDNCLLSDNTKVPCLTVYSCIKYDGVGVPDELELKITMVLDAKDSNTTVQEQRAFYTDSVNKFTETKSRTFQKQMLSCSSIYAYVKKDPNDKLSPIKITMEFKLIEKDQTPQLRNVLPPILDAYIPTITSFTAHILKDCGIDNICIPELAVSSFRVPREHKIGSSSPLEVMLIVFNRGEDSFNTNLWIDLPPGVAYSTISNQRSNVAVNCDSLKSDPSKVSCFLGNPMQKNSQSEFTLVLTPTNADNTQSRLVFKLFVNSTNPENPENYGNNHDSFEIPVTIDEPEVLLFGVSNPELIVLNITEDKGEDKGRQVKHVFQLKNQAKFATNGTELQIKWPSHDRQGNPVLLIEKELEIEGSGMCKIIILTPINASNYVGLGNIATKVELGDDRNRRKRDAKANTIACSDRYCTIIQCHVGFLDPSASFILNVYSRLMARSFIQRREATEMYHITAVAFAKVKSLPFGLVTVDSSRFGVKSKEVVTKVNTDLHKPASRGVEIWVIALAVTAGLLALLLLILLLWWCGFFKRKKPMEEGYFVVDGKTVDNTVSD